MKKSLKRLLSLALCAALLFGLTPLGGILPSVSSLFSATASALNEYCGDNLTWSISGSVLTITGSGEMYNYGVYSGVTTAPWSDSCDSIQRVIFNSGVTSVGDYAFYGCYSLSTLTMNTELTSIGDHAFYGAAFHGFSAPYALTTIGANAFENCSQLQFVGFNSDLTEIGNEAFKGCPLIEQLNFPTSLTKIGIGAFNGCTSLSRVNFQSGLKEIGSCAFYNCSNLNEINLPTGLTSIGADAFTGTAFYNESGNWSNYVLYSYPYLLKAKHSPNVFQPGVSTDYSVTPGTKVIADEAFSGCSRVTTIHIPDSVAHIGTSAFADCTALTDVYYETGTQSDWDEIDIGSGNECLLNAVIHVYVPHVHSYNTEVISEPTCTQPGEKVYTCAGCGNTYTEYPPATGHSDADGDDYCDVCGSYMITSGVCGDDLNWYYDEINDNLIITGTGPMYDCKDNVPWAGWRDRVRTLSLDNLTYIGEQAFSFCSVLTDVVIPDTVTEIGSEAFAACVSLRNVEIPDSVERIGDAAFVECFSLKSMVIPDGVERIESATFAGCVSLEYLTIPKSVSYIGEEAFVMLDAETVSELLAAIAQAQAQGETTLFGMPIDVLAAAFEHPEGMLSQVVYSGTQEEWDAIEIGSGNEALLNATINVHTHVYSSEVIREPSCSAAGITIDSCACGYSHTVIYNALPHTDANSDGICDVCGNSTVTSGTCGTSLRWSYDVDTATITFTGSGRMNDYTADTMPWKGYRDCIRRILFNGTNISYVGSNAFLNCSSIEEAALPASVTELGNAVFEGCVSLKKATLLGAIDSLPTSLFEDCTALETVTLAEGTGDFSQRAFGNCKSLKTLVIPSSTQRIYANAFIGSGLEEIYIPDTVFMVAQYAFSGCDNLRKVRLTENTRYSAIAKSTFYGCSSLTDIVIPENVKAINDQAFYGCSSLEEINIPKSVTTIGSNVYSGCIGVTSITVDPDNSTYSSSGNCLIKTGAKTLLLGCKTSVIPDDGSVTSIGASAFEGCTGLTSIIIPYHITSIGSKAFADCTGLESITYRARTVSDLSASSDVFYNAGDLGEGIAVVFDDTVAKIPAYLFSTSDAEGRPNVKSMVIGKYCANIGKYAFAGCTRMTELTINSSIIYGLSDSDIFYDAGTEGDGIAVTFADDVTNVAQYLFKVSSDDHLPNVISVDLGSSVETIGMYAFTSLKGITSLDIPDSVITIDRDSFAGCTGLRELTLGSSVETIGNGAFASCFLLESVDLPESVRTIGSCAFQECLSLESVTIPEGVTSIGSEAFILCSSLTSVTIPSSMTSIASGVFSYCTGLTEVTIPKSVTEIGSYAFCLTIDESVLASLRSVYEQGPEAFDFIPMDKLADIINDPDSALTDVYYSGTSDDWDAIVIGSNNDDLLNATIHMHEHDFASEITTPATCIETGVITYTCACGYSYTGVIPTTSHTDADFDGVCDVCGGDPSDLTLGVEKKLDLDSGESISLRFVPKVSGTYTLISFDKSEGSDPFCALTDKNGDRIAKNDDGNGLFNFKLQHELYKGQTYFFVCKNNYSGDSSFTVLLTMDSRLSPLEAAGGAGTVIDDENGLIFGIAPNVTNIGDYIAAKEGYSYVCAASSTSGENDIYSTGSVVTVYAGDIPAAEYTLVLFGDVDGDGKYDGFDAYLVSCLDCGALAPEDLSAASLAAADCNHDGAINGYDVNILVRAGILLGEVDQTGMRENNIESDSAYFEYLELIEQAPQTGDDEAAETEQVTQPAAKTPSLIERILTIFKAVLSFLRELFF